MHPPLSAVEGCVLAFSSSNTPTPPPNDPPDCVPIATFCAKSTSPVENIVADAVALGVNTKFPFATSCVTLLSLK
jgi:hypothetical protein